MCIMAEVILVAVAMHYLYRATIYVYKCRLKYVYAIVCADGNNWLIYIFFFINCVIML